jgi:hypothetical protein
MKIRILGIVIAALMFCLSNTLCASDSYCIDFSYQMTKPAYKKSFCDIFKGEHHLDHWLKGCLKESNGVETPYKTLIIGNKKYELYEICEPHNCAGKSLYVIFQPGGTHAWALFTKDDGTSRFFGNPDKKMQAAFKSAQR